LAKAYSDHARAVFRFGAPFSEENPTMKDIAGEFMRRVTPSLRRRTFVGAAFAGLGITGLSAEPPKAKAGTTPMREFGKTGVKLTIIGQGGARLALMRTKEAARIHVGMHTTSA
jgi:hypothetical protein